jgi:aerobic-type carbon monoxide dehydrogenase small subunit (CoxS/CutS family)
MTHQRLREITFTVNNRQRTCYVDVRKSLLDMLRIDLGLTGSKEGCGVGECGACSVLVDDVLVDSCIYLAVWVDGKTIRTVEGEAKNGELTKVQKAYVEQGAVQCGFCTPGFIMASTVFAEKKKGKKATEKEIREAHAGNLCRCTGYQNILKAVEKSLES